VNHTIGVGDFSTDIVGVRQPTASLPTVDNFLQSLKQNLLKRIVEKQKQAKEGKQTDANGNVIDQKDEVLKTIGGELTVPKSPVCKPSTPYEKYAPVTPTTNKRTFAQVATQIEIQIKNRIPDDNKLKYVIFAAMYLGSGYDKGFEAYENNFSSILLTESWQAIGRTYFGRRPFYFCLKDSSNTERPYAAFANLSDHIIILIEKWKGKMSSVTGDVESITKFVILNQGVYKTKDESVYNSMTDADKSTIKTKVEDSIKIFNSI
jgi:hypothetical protein